MKPLAQKCFVAITGFLFYCAPTHAADSSTFFHGWTSATHFGYSVEDQSSTGFKKAAGSTMLLDISKHISDKFMLGLRTIGSGAEANSLEFYRLGTGPLLSFRLTKKWALDLAVSFFQESATHEGEKAYSSKGQNVQFGWQRILPLAKNIDVSWGGFIARHWGNIDMHATSTEQSQSQKLYQPSRNVGTSRGVEIALRITL